jgi:hypothetical protein
VSTSSVMYKTRRVLGDMGELASSTIGGDGTTNQFELSASIVDNVTAKIQASAGGPPSVLSPGANGTAGDYTVDIYNGYIVLTNPLAVGQVLQVTYSTYETFIDADLYDYVTEAFALHTLNRNPPVFLDPVQSAAPPTRVLPVIEERLVALLAASQVYGDLATAAARDITIDTGDGTVIPRTQRYQQLVAEQARIEQEYRDVTNRLGIQGYDTVQMMNLRRVSKQTNRLVPVYLEQEWDDRRFPQRVEPPIDIPLGDEGLLITDRGGYNSALVYNPNDTVFEGGVEYLQIGTQPCSGVDPVADIAGGTDGISGFFWQITTINSGLYGYTGWAG